MSMQNTKQITCNLSAKDWQLHHKMEGAADAARDLNKAVERAVNRLDATRERAALAIALECERHARYGATDGETMLVAKSILDAFFRVQRHAA